MPIVTQSTHCIVTKLFHSSPRRKPSQPSNDINGRITVPITSLAPASRCIGEPLGLICFEESRDSEGSSIKSLATFVARHRAMSTVSAWQRSIERPCMPLVGSVEDTQVRKMKESDSGLRGVQQVYFQWMPYTTRVTFYVLSVASMWSLFHGACGAPRSPRLLVRSFI